MMWHAYHVSGELYNINVLTKNEVLFIEFNIPE